MNEYKIEVTLKLKGPIMTKSTAAGGFGIDAPFARNERAQLCLPLDLVKGRLRQAMKELNEAAGTDFDPPIGDWFGQESGDDIGRYEPARGLLNFTDFVYSEDHRDNRIYRICMDNERGAAKQGAYQVIEAPFQAGEKADFKGTISFFSTDQTEANNIREIIRQGFSWITSFGSQKSIGFGQLISVDVAQPQPAQPRTSISTSIAAETTHFDLVVTPLALFCLTNKQIDQNLFESDDIISGGALKGCIATTWLKHLGQHGEIRAGIDSNRPDLCKNFNLIRFTHAFAVKRGTRTRPVTIPYSMGVDKDNELYDVALFSRPVLIKGSASAFFSAPAFFMDWKNKVWKIANPMFGWDRPRHKLDVHHQHDRAKRKAEEAKLFAYDAVDPQEHEWLCTVDLSRVPQSDRAQVATQLQDLLRFELKDLGKTKSAVQVEFQEKPVITQKVELKTDLREGVWIITLQTHALICDPIELNETSGANELFGTYKQAWHDLSDSFLELKYYFAGQHLAGGKYVHQRFQSGNPYNPFLLTDAGSVFVFKPTSDEQKAKERIEVWLSHGLPLPDWAVSRYRRDNNRDMSGNIKQGSDWTNCPYIPENGYGEIAVNLETHWQLKPKGGYREI